MNQVFATRYRRPREGGGPGATAAALPALDSRFRVNDERIGSSLKFNRSLRPGSYRDHEICAERPAIAAGHRGSGGGRSSAVAPTV
jgi:hypothetical protein